MVSDDQILQTQTFFLHKMSQNERIQASTTDFIDPVPPCLYQVYSIGIIKRSSGDNLTGRNVADAGPGDANPILTHKFPCHNTETRRHILLYLMASGQWKWLHDALDFCELSPNIK